jgi:hypothetical protein
MKNRTLADATGPTDGRDGGNVVWVYAVTAEVGTDELSGVTGVAGEPVRAVTDAGLSAVVGTVGDIGHGDKPLTRLLVGLTAIETAGRAHRQVIASLAEENPVVPVQLATVYPDDATIRRQLAERHTELAVMVESVTAEHTALRADVTGLWPPYSFADTSQL